MHYQVSRNGQTYGPYTIEDLQRYLASGNVLPTDLAKSEEMTEWVPVSVLLQPPAEAAAPVSEFATPSFANPDPAYPQPVAMAASPYPDAPNLHWGLVVLFSVLTCCFAMIFMPVWNLIICLWLKRVQPNATAAIYYVAVLVLLVLYFVGGGAATLAILSHSSGAPFGAARYGPYFGLRLVVLLAIWVLRLVGRYTERALLLEHFNTVEPVGLTLDPVMTFFFGGVYFQYHLNRINALKQTQRFGAGARY